MVCKNLGIFLRTRVSDLWKTLGFAFFVCLKSPLHQMSLRRIVGPLYPLEFVAIASRDPELLVIEEIQIVEAPIARVPIMSETRLNQIMP
jgi:hypothetical protein